MWLKWHFIIRGSKPGQMFRDKISRSRPTLYAKKSRQFTDFFLGQYVPYDVVLLGIWCMLDKYDSLTRLNYTIY